MKHVLRSALVGLALLAAPLAQAENVSLDKVKDAAAHYLQHTTSLVRISASQLSVAHQWVDPADGSATMYLLTAPELGWIIMTTESLMDPVVAFSDDNIFDVENMPESLEWWLDNYNGLVCEVKGYAAKMGGDDHPDWTILFNHGMVGNTKDSQVRLMQEAWDQGNSKGTDYNLLMPVINGTVCPAGCGATAVAQIIHYYKYPKQPVGSINYKVPSSGERLILNLSDSAAFDYDLMPNRINAYSSTYEERYEVSRLQYYVGVALKMQYAPEGSGSYVQSVPSAIRNHFKYELGTLTFRQQSSDSIYMENLRNSLINGNPLFMGGSSAAGGGRDGGGHAWVCCGYRTENTKMYFMNWGWGGSSNGFYNLYENNMPISGMGYNFNQGQSYVRGMVPPADSLLAIADVDADGFGLGKAYPNPANHTITIPFSSKMAADLQVYSVDGRMVTSRHVYAGDGEVVLRVDSMPAGVYIYRMGNSYGKFIVKQ